MIFLKRFLDFSIFSSAILLAFLLAFERFLEIPEVVGWIGRWHPLVLHFPIVLILVTVIQYWRKDTYFEWYLNVTAFLTLITAITGFLLSLEGTAKGNLILIHQWLGVSVAYIVAIWYWINQNKQAKYLPPILIQSILLILIVITGHYGGMVTHGKDFLSFSEKEGAELISIPDNPNVFTHVIQPILNEKCIKCHNPNKAKAELILSGIESINKGGKSGIVIDHNDPGKSKLLASISLPLEEEGHMPPLDEEQLTDDEMILISDWISLGAPTDLDFNDLEITEPSYTIIEKLIADSRSHRWASLPDISDNEIDKLSSNYIRLIRFYNRSGALQVIVYPHKNYESSGISGLKPIAENIIELNFSGIPIKNQELEFIDLCRNIEKLNLSNTPLDDDGVNRLKKLEKLTELKIYNTKISDKALDQIAQFPGLSSLYVYNTDVTADGISRLMKAKSELTIIKTVEQAENFISVLPPPTVGPNTSFFSKPVRIKLGHPLQGIDIFYTTDGSTPNESSFKASDSLNIGQSLQLKYYAAKSGWESSQIDSVNFYKTLGKPDRFMLKNQPNSRFVGKGEFLLFDMEKGSGDFGDSTWMAFREESFILNAEWEEEVVIGSVVLSSMVNTDPYLFPPESIVIRGGMEKSDMNVLARLIPEKLEERKGRYFEFYDCKIDRIPIRYIEIVVQPLQRIPMWHPGKGEKGWFFIDEVVFEKGS